MIDSENKGFGLALHKHPGAPIPSDGPGKSSQSEWVEMLYDPEDEIDCELLSAMTQLIDDRVSLGLSRDDMEATLRALAHKFHNSDGW